MMIHEQQPAVSLLSIGMIGLGTLSVLSRDFGYTWQPVPAFHPGRELLAVICGLFMIAVSVALLFRVTTALAARVLFPFLLAWWCLQLPAVLAAPQIEGVWIGLGEIGMLLAGGWVLFACLSGLQESPIFRTITSQRGIRYAQVLFGIAVIPVGLGHLFYAQITASLVPSWLPFRLALAYLTGVGQIACGLGIVFRVWPRAVAWIETVMLALFAFLVWGPDSWIASTPKLPGMPTGPRFALTAFFITWVVGASAWLIADNSPEQSWSTKNRSYS